MTEALPQQKTRQVCVSQVGVKVAIIPHHHLQHLPMSILHNTETSPNNQHMRLHKTIKLLQSQISGVNGQATEWQEIVAGCGSGRRFTSKTSCAVWKESLRFKEMPDSVSGAGWFPAS